MNFPQNLESSYQSLKYLHDCRSMYILCPEDFMELLMFSLKAVKASSQFTLKVFSVNWLTS